MKDSSFRVAQVAFMIAIVVLFGILIAVIAKQQQVVVVNLEPETDKAGDAADAVIVADSGAPTTPMGFQFGQQSTSVSS